PRILYNRAQELLNDRQANAADALLIRAEKADYNTQLLPLIHFWRGEIAYRDDRSEDAVPHLNQYLKSPVFQGEATVSNANYILGYAEMDAQDWRESASHFQQVKSGTDAVIQDASLRLADCYYMQKSWNQALDIYNNAISKH